jgi:hypothetical protein
MMGAAWENRASIFKKKKGQVSTPLCTVTSRLYSGFGGVNGADLATKQP